MFKRFFVLTLSLLLCGLSKIEPASAAGKVRGEHIGSDITVSQLMELKSFLAPKAVLVVLDNPDAPNQTPEQYLAWLSTRIDYLKTILPVMDSLGMKVVLRMASPPGGHVPGLDPPVHGPFHSDTDRAAFLDAWELIATAFKDSNVIVAYSPLSEPGDPSVTKWNSLAQDVATLIRSIDSKKLILISTVYGNPAYLSRLKLPKKVKNVALEFHFYLTSAIFNFVHQHTYNNLTIPYPSKNLTKKVLNTAFAKIMTKAKKKGIKSVYITEITVPRFAPNSKQYLSDVLSIIEKNGAKGWFHLGWNGASVWDVRYSDNLDDNTISSTVTGRAQVLKDLFSKSKPITSLK